MTTFRLQELGSSLASRARGRELRLQVKANDGPCTLDFAEVLSVSESFADELLGVLVADHGVDWLSQHIAFENVSTPVRGVILDVIERRTTPTVNEEDES